MLHKTVAAYETVEKLGQGGIGVVYRAVDTRLHRTVALKFLPAHLSTDEDAKRRFVQEASVKWCGPRLPGVGTGCPHAAGSTPECSVTGEFVVARDAAWSEVDVRAVRAPREYRY